MPGAGTTEVARAAYLADTSAFTRLDKPHVAAAIGPLIAEGKIALCAPVAFELGFSARSGADHDAISDLDGKNRSIGADADIRSDPCRLPLCRYLPGSLL